MTKLYDCYSSQLEADQAKRDFYESHVETEEEKEKRIEFLQRLFGFVETSGKMDDPQAFFNTTEGKIHYREDIGYISSHTTPTGLVDVFFYGKTEDEAFINGAIDYEFLVNGDYEYKNRQQLNQSFKRRFQDPEDTTEGYHAPFFFAELALQDFRKYYGENIPEEIIKYYEIYASKVELRTVRYDYESNGFVKEKKR